jgi:elongation factor Ts
MTAITPAMIKELRERTGVGMGKCKEALEEAKGDMELAIANLRKAGVASAVKKQGRDTNEGLIGVAENKDRIAILELNAETDFVVKNERFGQLLKELVEEAAVTNPASLEAFMQQKYSKDPSVTIDQYRSLAIQAIGENIQIRRLQVIPKVSNKSVGIYSHMGGKIVCMTEISGVQGEEGLAKDIAMHSAAAAPEYLSPEHVPTAVIDNEKDIAAGQLKDKPANIRDKIIEGKLNAYYDQVCLARQKFIKDDQLTIAELIAQRGKAAGKPLSLTGFFRWVVGQ